MNLEKDVSLSNYSTMGLGGTADYLVKIQGEGQIKESMSWARENSQPVLMIGGGSNIIWKDEGFRGLVIVNQIKGFDFNSTDDMTYQVVIGAGEVWDEVVEKTTRIGLSGIEGLSLIPGLVGATPVQNVGAYGQEIADSLASVRAYDTSGNTFVELTNADCQFTYRSSFFKLNPGRYFITSLTLTLSKTQMKPPFYPSLEKYISENAVTDFSPASIRNAVINIRKAKLPDPKTVKNCGSFFGNPIVPRAILDTIKAKYSDIPYWEVNNGDVKLSAAWLINQVGFNNYVDQETGMATWPKQALVFVNQKAKSTNDLLIFKNKVVSAVRDKFNVELTQEPELLP